VRTGNTNGTAERFTFSGRPTNTPAVGRPADAWYDDDAGPVVRLYAMTGGRTGPGHSDFELATLVRAVSSGALPAGLTPEQRAILRLANRAVSVPEVAAHLRLPLGTVRVLLSDLREAGLIDSPGAGGPGDEPSENVLERVLSGLLAL
jgi:hypothetical protein